MKMGEHMKVKHVLDAVWSIAPRELAEEWDNVGLLAGHPENPVTKVLCALDLTGEVLSEAVEIGAEAIVTHHPILFRGRKNLREDDPEGALLARLVRSNIALIAMHTNFDNAEPGVNDALASAMELKNVQKVSDCMRIGEIDAMPLAGLTSRTAEKLNTVVRTYGASDRSITKVAVMGGSGGDYYREAVAAGADAFITGEIGYHYALNAVDEGLCVLEAGHAATERVAVSSIASGLKAHLDNQVTVFESTAHR